MTEMLLFKDNKFMEKRDPTYSAPRQAWKKHLSGCRYCMRKFMEAFRNAENKENVLRTIPYSRSCKLDKKTGIITCTFLCGTKCSVRVAIATEPIPVAKKTPSRRVKLGREGETVVRDHKYMVSPEEADWRREVVRNNKKRVRANRAAMERGEISCGVSTFWKQFGL